MEPWKRASEWNGNYKIGQQVTYIDDYHRKSLTKTRSSAWVLGNNTVVILLEGRTGAVLLSRVKAISSQKKSSLLRRAGEELRDQGIQQSLFNAERKDPGWSDKAHLMLATYLQKIGDRPFKTETLSAWAYKCGLKEPPNSKAWGGVMVAAKNKKIIKAIGATAATLPSSHRGYITLWQKCEEGD